MEVETMTALDGTRRCVAGVSHVVRLIGEGFARPVGEFLILSTHLADRVHGPIVPCNPCFAIHIRPFAVDPMERPVSIAVFIQGDVERATAPIAHLPFAQEMAAGRRPCWCRTRVADSDTPGSGELDARHIGDVESLPVAVFENDDKLAGT